MKKIGYLIFATLYYLCCICPIKRNKVFYIMTHDSSDGSNVGVLIERLKESGEYQFYGIGKEENIVVNEKVSYTKFGTWCSKIKGYFLFFIRKPYHLATAAIVAQDNVFMPMAYLKFRKSVKVIQLWHGTGTIKKFGQSVNTGKIAKLEKKANQTITHLVVNSELSKRQSIEAFGISEDKIKLLGLPRTDLFFNDAKKAQVLERFYECYPDLKNKKILLYAPTFRDNEVLNPKVELDINLMLDGLDEEYVLALKLHPFVAHAFNLNTNIKYQDRVVNLSNYKDINGLMLAAELLITDYSSIIFEYCLLNKPMIFYAYDLDAFSENGRGFYEKYEEYVPGVIVKTTEELVKQIQKGNYDIAKIKRFTQENYQNLDGKATDRVVQQILCEL